ncbi:MAG: dual specificity protein phosphatase family protein [Candidatus Heimdallarchaeota archaeon]|nr:dual specificity protein phosphatase family protein [Candidatus Heimdallarchaeota archaeon]MDH5645993.1 dual specificity protein phosphatase family protein [Candidatus Heimdallarchaeota archaeon]
MYLDSAYNWLFENRILLSQYPSQELFDFYVDDLKIDVIISLTESKPQLDLAKYKKSILHLHFPIKDFSIPSVEETQSILQKLYYEYSNEKVIVIHCIAGCGRTGTIATLLYWLIINKEGIATSIQDSLSFVRKVRPCSVESSLQEEFLRNFVLTYDSNI